MVVAGEWHELERLPPDFAGKRVLDLGCGYGWHCTYAAEHGASNVLSAGFALTAMVEPMPTKEMLENVPGMEDELRRPMMLLVAAQK